MQWLNEPKEWTGNTDRLVMTTAPATDFWRITHYGFIRDSGPFYYTEQQGDFEATVKFTGNYTELYHQAGLMLRTDEKNWIKTGIEYVNGVQYASAVVTHEVSDWNVAPCNGNPESIWLKVQRRDDCVQVEYSTDNITFHMLRLAWFEPGIKVQAGMFAAAPGEKSFTVTFEDFKVIPA